jgi:hypothetical protein
MKLPKGFKRTGYADGGTQDPRLRDYSKGLKSNKTRDELLRSGYKEETSSDGKTYFVKESASTTPPVEKTRTRPVNPTPIQTTNPTGFKKAPPIKPRRSTTTTLPAQQSAEEILFIEPSVASAKVQPAVSRQEAVTFVPEQTNDYWTGYKLHNIDGQVNQSEVVTVDKDGFEVKVDPAKWTPGQDLTPYRTGRTLDQLRQTTIRDDGTGKTMLPNRTTSGEVVTEKDNNPYLINKPVKRGITGVSASFKDGGEVKRFRKPPRMNKGGRMC